tara:strand:+ start:94 stop:486 length:393 start_codon:yes stop_codon:yes gene_type:complete
VFINWQYFQFAYLAMSLIIGVAMIFEPDTRLTFAYSNWVIGLSIIFTSFLSWWAGSGLRGSFYKEKEFHVGNKFQLISGIIGTLLFLSISLLWSYYLLSEIIIYFFNGPIWCLVGFAIGFIFTTKKQVYD